MAAFAAARGTWVFGAAVGVDRVQLGLAAGLFAVALAGCGSSTATIPKGTPSPKPQVTAIAPGVTVPKAQVALPSYTVSSSHPLPSGVSAQQVVQDVQIDNVIENIAIERQDPALLAYADTGDWLAAEKTEISQNTANQVKVLSISDTLTSVQVGAKPDPKDGQADLATIIVGSERRVVADQAGKDVTTTKGFDALLWVIWSQPLQRYLICDTATS
jgi:hypothetical protein